MRDRDVQIVSNEKGEPTAAIVPIELWHEILAERETARLLCSDEMRQRLISAIHRKDGLSLDNVAEKLDTRFPS